MSNTENTPNNDTSNNGNDSPDLNISANSLGGLASSQAAVLHPVLPDSIVSEAINNVQVS